MTFGQRTFRDGSKLSLLQIYDNSVIAPIIAGPYI